MLLLVTLGVTVLTILLLMAVPLWETELQRDLEDELIFRARQYVRGIELYLKKHNNMYPQSFAILHLERCLRKLYPDPMSDDGKWDVVMKDTMAGKNQLMIVPAELLGQYLTRAAIVGVCSTSPQEGFREYRGKKRYNEWAFYVGEKESESMPAIRIVTAP